MVSPFRLEEILPDIPTGPVRFPRRQSGGSPQGLATTLLADYTLRTRAWLPSAAIVALLAESDVTPGGARTAISRLARRGVLESNRQGRHTFYRLTPAAAFALAFGGNEVVAFAVQAESWDGCWTIIAFSLPQEGDSQRRALRGQLRWLGFAPLYDALWVSPQGLPSEATKALAEISLGALTVFRAHRVELGTAASRDPLEAWDMAGIAGHYESFVQRWSPLLPQIRAGRVCGAKALQARTEVMDSYRRFKALDPRLPMRLMPDGWLREHARDVFESVYDGLAEPALDHVLSIVSRFAGHALPDIRTHSVADLLAGLLPGACPTRAESQSPP